MNPHLEFLLSTVYDGALAPAHREDLEKSGLGKDIIEAQFIRSVPPRLIPQLLGFDIPAITSALLFPFRSPAGGFMDHVRMKIFPTLVKVTRDGGQVYVPAAELSSHDIKPETVKYLQPKGSGPRLYFVSCCLREVLEGDGPVWVIEGEKKSAAAAQLGLAAVGFTGIHAWHRRGSRALLADFERIPLRRRVVELVPDGDVAMNPAVETGTADFADALERACARVRIVLLPVAA